MTRRLLAALPLLAALIAPLDAAAAPPPVPHSLLFGMGSAALLGPVGAQPRIYGTRPGPSGAVGKAVDVELDSSAAGTYLLRLPLDEAALPASARPGRVRVMREALLRWVEVPNCFLLRAARGREHAIVVPIQRSGVYALVLGAPQEPAPADILLRHVLERFRAWMVAEAGVDVTGSFRARDLRALGRLFRADLARVRIIRSSAGAHAAGVLSGVFDFFLRPMPPSRAFAFGDRVYLFGQHLFRAATTRKAIVATLGHAYWTVLQQQRLGEAYLGEWASQLVEHGATGHPMDREARAQAARAVRRLGRRR